MSEFRRRMMELLDLRSAAKAAGDKAEELRLEDAMWKLMLEHQGLTPARVEHFDPKQRAAGERDE